MVIKNIRYSNCNILVRVVKQLKHALNMSVQKKIPVVLLLVKNVAVFIFFFLKNTLIATTIEMNLTAKYVIKPVYKRINCPKIYFLTM